MAKTRDPSFPGLDAFKVRMGRTRPQRIAAARRYAEERGYSDIVLRCDEAATAAEVNSASVEAQVDAIGFVYLFKFGKFYKSGEATRLVAASTS